MFEDENIEYVTECCDCCNGSGMVDRPWASRYWMHCPLCHGSGTIKKTYITTRFDLMDFE